MLKHWPLIAAMATYDILQRDDFTHSARDITLTSREPVEGKSSVCDVFEMCLKYSIQILIIIIIIIMQPG